MISINRHLINIPIITLLLILFWDWSELNTSGGLGFIRNNIAWLFVVLLTCYGFIRLLVKKEFKAPRGSLIVFIGFALAVSPFFINPTKFFSYGILLPLALLIGLLFFYSLLQLDFFREKHNKVLVTIAVVAFAEVLIGCWQVFHSIMMQLTSDATQYELIEIDGTFNQRNVFATFVASGLIISFYLLIKPSAEKINRKLINFNLLFLFLGSFILFLNHSKVGLFSFLIGVCVLALTHKSDINKILGYLTPIIVGLVLAFLFSKAMFSESSTGFSKTDSRVIMFSTSIEAITKEPVLGHGLGSFERVYLDTLIERIEAGEFNSAQPARNANISHPHNELLYWGVQGGVISIIGLLLMFLAVVYSTQKAGIRANLIHYCLLIPILMHLMVELPFYISGVHIILFVVLLGYIINNIGTINSFQLKANSLVLASGVALLTLIGVGTAIVLLVNSYSLSRVVEYQSSINRTEQQLQSALIAFGWEDAYESLLLKHRANIAVKKGQEEPIRDYLSWLERQNEISPRLQYFYNIYYSYQILGQPESAKKARDNIERYYSGTKVGNEWLQKH